MHRLLDAFQELRRAPQPDPWPTPRCGPAFVSVQPFPLMLFASQIQVVLMTFFPAKYGGWVYRDEERCIAFSVSSHVTKSVADLFSCVSLCACALPCACLMFAGLRPPSLPLAAPPPKSTLHCCKPFLYKRSFFWSTRAALQRSGG